jgi:hypothetical protein
MNISHVNMLLNYLTQILDEFWEMEKKVAILNVILPLWMSGGLDDLQNRVDGDVTTMFFLRWIGWQDHRWDVGVKEK